MRLASGTATVAGGAKGEAGLFGPCWDGLCWFVAGCFAGCELRVGGWRRAERLAAPRRALSGRAQRIVAGQIVGRLVKRLDAGFVLAGVVFAHARARLGCRPSGAQIDVVGNAEVLEHALGNLGEDRRRDAGAVVGAFGRVQDDGHGEHRVVDRGEAGEGSDVHGLRVGVRGRIDLLRGAGFSAGGVAVELRLFAGAEEHDAFHHLAHLRGGKRGDDAMRARGKRIGQTR